MKTKLSAKLLIYFFLLLVVFHRQTYAQCPASATLVITESRCRENGSITVNVSPAGSYSYEITSGPELAALSPSNIFTGLQAGNYVVTIHGSGSCTLNMFATVPGNYKDPGLLNATVTDVFCPGGTGTLTATEPADGRRPYTYSIISGPVTRPNQPGTAFPGLPAGTYKLQAYDSCGVVRTSDFSVGYDTAEFYGYANFWDVTTINCNDLKVNTTKGFYGITSHSQLKLWYVTPAGDTLKVNNYSSSSTDSDTLIGKGKMYGNWQILVFDECNRMRSSTFRVDPPSGIYLTPSNTTCTGTTVVMSNPFGYGVPVHYRVRRCTNDSTVYEVDTTGSSDPIIINNDTCYIFEAINQCGDTIRQNGSFTRPEMMVAACDQPSCSNNGKVAISVYSLRSTLIGPITVTIIAGPSNVGAVGWITEYNLSVTFDNLLPGTYTVVASSPCGKKDTLTVNANNPLVRIIEVTQNKNCSGGANLHVKITSNFYSCAYFDQNTAYATYVYNTSPFYAPLNQNAVRVTPTSAGVWEADYLNVTATSLRLTVVAPGLVCSFDTTVAVSLYTPPTLTNVRGYVCNASQIATVSYTVNNGVPPFRFRIRQDASSAWGPWQDSAIFTGITAGTYDVNVEDGCPNGSIRTINFTPWDKSPINLSLPCGVIGSPLTLSADPILSTVTYQWILNGTVISSSPSFTIPSYSVANNGLYKVRQTYRGGVCVDSSSRMLISCSVLSISMGDLEAKYVNNTSVLSWKTNKEIGQVTFIIERSNDGRSFSKIGDVKSQEQLNGTYYSFSDNHPANDNFYRIRYVNESGKPQYSNIVRISKNELVSIPVTIRPVPFKSWFVMQIKADKRTQYSVVLYDLTGNKVAKKQVNIIPGTNTVWFDQEVENLAAGYYFVEITGPDFKQRNKILKQ